MVYLTPPKENKKYCHWSAKFSHSSVASLDAKLLSCLPAAHEAGGGTGFKRFRLRVLGSNDGMAATGKTPAPFQGAGLHGQAQACPVWWNPRCTSCSGLRAIHTAGHSKRTTQAVALGSSRCSVCRLGVGNATEPPLKGSAQSLGMQNRCLLLAFFLHLNEAVCIQHSCSQGS